MTVQRRNVRSWPSILWAPAGVDVQLNAAARGTLASDELADPRRFWRGIRRPHGSDCPDSLDLESGLLEDLVDGAPVGVIESQAHTAVGAEVAGDGGELARCPDCLQEAFQPDRMAGGVDQDDAVAGGTHGWVLAMVETASRARSSKSISRNSHSPKPPPHSTPVGPPLANAYHVHVMSSVSACSTSLPMDRFTR